MRAPEEPKRGHHYRRAKPRNESWKLVIGEREPGREQIDYRQEKGSYRNDDHEGAISPVRSADRLFIVLGSRRINPTNNHVGNEADEKDNVPRLNSHGDRRCRIKIAGPRDFLLIVNLCD